MQNLSLSHCLNKYIFNFFKHLFETQRRGRRGRGRNFWFTPWTATSQEARRFILVSHMLARPQTLWPWSPSFPRPLARVQSSQSTGSCLHDMPSLQALYLPAAPVNHFIKRFLIQFYNHIHVLLLCKEFKKPYRMCQTQIPRSLITSRIMTVYHNKCVKSRAIQSICQQLLHHPVLCISQLLRFV